jgi:phosphopantothenoylcysteine synthetase/decarboxylase
VKDPKDLVRCDRQLFEKLKALDAGQLMEKTKPHLTKDEVKGAMARRDKIVAYFQKLIAEKGENEVLY